VGRWLEDWGILGSLLILVIVVEFFCHYGNPEVVILSLVYIFYLAFLVFHFWSIGPRSLRLGNAVLGVVGVPIGFATAVCEGKTGSLFVFVTLFVIFGIALYIALCEALLLVLARYLTAKLGERWA